MKNAAIVIPFAGKSNFPSLACREKLIRLIIKHIPLPCVKWASFSGVAILQAHISKTSRYA